MSAALTDRRIEAALLGSVLLDPRALRRVLRGMDRSYLFYDAHKAIWDAYLGLAADGSPIDSLTVAHRLRENGTLKTSGGSAYLVELSTITPVAANVEAYATQLRELSVVRDVSAVAQSVHESCLKLGTSDSRSELVDDCQRRLLLATKPMAKRAGFNAGRQTIGAISADLIAAMERSERGDTVDPMAITTTFKSLDRRVQIPVGGLTCIAGEPGSGKSSLVRGMCMRWHRDHGRRPHIVKTEDINRHTVIREVASITGLAGRKVRDVIYSTERGRLAHDDRDRVSAALVQLLTVNWTVEDTPGLSAESVAMQCRDAVHEGADTLVVDTFTRMALPRWRNATKTEKVDHNIEVLASLAQELNVPLLVLAHLRRINEERLPNMGDIRDSGNWENNCRLILIPHRRDGRSCVIVAKANHDQAGPVDMVFDEPTTTWAEPPATPSRAVVDPTQERYS